MNYVMMTEGSLLNFSDNISVTTLSDNIASGDVQWNVASSSGFPPAPFEFLIDGGLSAQELCVCTNVASPTVWEVTRGWDGTTAVSHSAGAVIALTTSAGIFQTANNHLTQDEDQHVQYLRADGTRHDNPLNHSIGNYSGAAVNTANLTPPPNSHWGDIASPGTSINPAANNHVHGRESIDELQSGLYPAGTMVLWAGGTLPQGWLPADGRDVRTDLAPQLFNQIGYSFGAAIDWYPPPPVIPTFLDTVTETLEDPYNGAILEVEVPYASMTDIRSVAMEMPPGAHLYFKVPNMVSPPGTNLVWLIKVDYGYEWTPRPEPPMGESLYTAPYVVDGQYPSVNVYPSQNYQPLPPGNWRDSPTDPNQAPWYTYTSIPQISLSVSHTPGQYKSPFTWGYDSITGLPVIFGEGYLSPGQYVVGPFMIPVVPNGAALPNGTTLLSPPGPLVPGPPPAIVNAELIEVQRIGIPLTNGFGYLQTSIPWSSLAGAPTINGSDPDPDTDAVYFGGNVYAQESNGNVLFTCSEVQFINPSNQTVTSPSLFVVDLPAHSSRYMTGTCLIIYPVYVQA